MYEITSESEVKLVEKRSRFITRSFKVQSEEEASARLQEIRSASPDAGHHCYAWRILKPNGQVYIKRSDDGEPTGTAGAPMLACLVGENLVGILVVTSRWFGGVKLGTGGLASMYKKGVVEVIKVSGKRKYEMMVPARVTVHISKADHLLSLLEKQGFSIQEKSFGERVVVTLSLPESRKDELEQVASRVAGEILTGD
jgi:uncharacterized YigZ family protein